MIRKIIMIGLLIFLGGILIQNNPTYASDLGLKLPNEINTNIDNCISYTTTTTSAVNINQIFNVDLYIDNTSNISAEDLIIKYDTNKLEYLGFNEISNKLDLIDNISTTTQSQVRFILTSKGSGNVITLKEKILNLKFKSKEIGESVVYVGKGKITDGLTMERNLSESEKGGIIIKVNSDVNGDNVFTLLDLGIDSRHLGENANSDNGYTMDCCCDGKIDRNDLIKIERGILNNEGYWEYEK